MQTDDFYRIQMKPETNPAENEIKANEQLLENLSTRIGTLTTAEYTWRYKKSAGSIGKHIRHIIDHYTCFFRTLADSYVDYDNRARVSVLETSADAASGLLKRIVHQLSDLRHFSPGKIYVYISIAPDEKAAPVESNLKRELLFLQSHTLHHMAVIQLMLDLLGSQVEPEFAYAPSTKKFLMKNGSRYE
jgi:uncharacterized damage-inducible protein DinB